MRIIGLTHLKLEIKDNILYCLNENLESLPMFAPPSKAGSFLKNPDLFAVAKKFADYLAPAKKKIFSRQKVLFEQNSKKVSKAETKKSTQTAHVSTPVETPYIPEPSPYSHTYVTPAPSRTINTHISTVAVPIVSATSPVNAQSNAGKPHNLRQRSFKTNYRVLGGDLVNPPLVLHETAEKPSLPTGQLLQDRNGIY